MSQDGDASLTARGRSTVISSDAIERARHAAELQQSRPLSTAPSAFSDRDEDEEEDDASLGSISSEQLIATHRAAALEGPHATLCGICQHELKDPTALPCKVRKIGPTTPHVIF